ncbi:fused PTS fructose transporter subunit IIA/HPr protein [Agarivorans sp. TSD2052]|uniref:fused PTS fructose transporter subunit IIA/HPr protein n=1 Tax=Agarivorans sp. TSD2052 TaxID=2937286 RepID=UPI0020106F20|nr:fused PTS fructose transporter subunit IIA/HPr protein [Agarivorans sp. TSD2052]UPW16819.1 fused PTS fructose transporter subunit IIA/HPr protein [Agarivorans sp. TSD2052]
MLTLVPKDIHLDQSAENKQSAITFLAKALFENGLVTADYVNGMLEREQVNSTYLGNGIAIPHGTTETRSLVKSTGVSVHHYPLGVDWGDGNTVYLAIGIAAKSAEHLVILKQLTKVLSMDGADELIRNATNIDTLINLLNGDTQLEVEFDSQLVLDNFPVNSLIQLKAVAAGTLKNRQLINQQAIAAALEINPGYLANGYWLSCLTEGALRSGACVVKVAEEFEHENLPVKGLLMVSAANPCYASILEALSLQLFEDGLVSFAQLTTTDLVNCLTQQQTPSATPSSGDNVAVFEITNLHGLHARPGALLVAEAKKFSSSINVTNISSESATVNAKSLMKVMTLGVKYKDKLQFVADGDDAPHALEALGNAIAAGLGED